MQVCVHMTRSIVGHMLLSEYQPQIACPPAVLKAANWCVLRWTSLWDRLRKNAYFVGDTLGKANFVRRPAFRWVQFTFISQQRANFTPRRIFLGHVTCDSSVLVSVITSSRCTDACVVRLIKSAPKLFTRRRDLSRWPDTGLTLAFCPAMILLCRPRATLYGIWPGVILEHFVRCHFVCMSQLWWFCRLLSDL